jgi:LEA14-like dessication related protein
MKCRKSNYLLIDSMVISEMISHTTKAKSQKNPYPLLSLVVLTLSLVSCVGWIFEKPVIVLREVSLSPLSFTEMKLLLGLDVQNTNRFDMTLKTFEYTAYLNNEKIGTGRMEQEVRIPSASTTRVQAPIAASFKNLSGSLKTLVAGLTGKEIPYKIEGKARIQTIFGGIDFPFSKEGFIR